MLTSQLRLCQSCWNRCFEAAGRLQLNNLWWPLTPVWFFIPLEANASNPHPVIAGVRCSFQANTSYCLKYVGVLACPTTIQYTITHLDHRVRVSYLLHEVTDVELTILALTSLLRQKHMSYSFIKFIVWNTSNRMFDTIRELLSMLISSEHNTCWIDFITLLRSAFFARLLRLDPINISSRVHLAR